MTPHPAEWTPERIGQFWAWVSRNEALRGHYFADRVGHDVVSRLARYLPRRATVVDYGAGSGTFARHLQAAGFRVRAVEVDDAGVEVLERALAGDPNFAGASLAAAVPDGFADAVTALEVIEHLDDAALTGLLAQARRMLRPGGVLLLTTPNEENLEARHTMCPECGAIFHPIQHVRSWSVGSLSGEVERNGFRTRLCVGTFFSTRRGALAAVERTIRTATGRRPNLLYVGERR